MMTCRQRLLRSIPIWAFIVSGICVGRVTATLAIEAQCQEILQQALEDKNPDTRKQAVVALSLVGTQFLSSLSGMLRDNDVDVRLAAVASLAEVKNDQAAAALRDAVRYLEQAVARAQPQFAADVVELARLGDLEFLVLRCKISTRIDHLFVQPERGEVVRHIVVIPHGLPVALDGVWFTG